MGLGDVVITRQEGGVGRPLPGKDHYSGIMTFIANADLPAGFSTSDRIKQVFSLAEAESLGIVATSAVDEVKVLHYHIDQFFFMAPKGVLYIGLFDSLSIDYTTIKDLQNFADGELRQVGIVDLTTTFATANVTTIDSAIDDLRGDHKPLIALYGADIIGLTIATADDLRALTDSKVGCVGLVDSANLGKTLSDDTTYAIPEVGLVLGGFAAAKVNEDPGWVSKFNLVNGARMQDPAIFEPSILIKDQAGSALDTAFDKGWIFGRKIVGRSGTYLAGCPACIAVTSDYAYLNDTRTMDKAVRGVYSRLSGYLNAPLTVDPSTGYLAEDTIGTLVAVCEKTLDEMVTANELSGGQALINPEQNVLSTGKVEVTLKLIARATGREYDVSIGYALTLI